MLPLTPKSVETLLVLLENRGSVVEKDELLRRIWPDTFVEEGSLSRNISVLRKTLGDSPEGHEFIVTIPKRGYRFVAEVQVVEANDLASLPGEAGLGPAQISGVEVFPHELIESEPRAGAAVLPVPGRRKRRWKVFLTATAAVILVAAALALWLMMSRTALSFASHDWVLITDFENQTGDPRFDKALLTAFTVSLEQSRHMNVFPRARLGGALKRMGQSEEQTITERLGREICLRENIRGLLTCGITRTGRQYALSAQLIDPQTGNPVRSYTARADGEDRILDALDTIATNVRRDLGESLSSINRSARPLPQVTTRSLEALQKYADAGVLWEKSRRPDEAVRLYLAALESDPDFAMAHAALGSTYFSHWVSKPALGREHFEKALRLSERVTSRERLYIQADYQSNQGHFDDAERLYGLYLRDYPDDLGVQLNLAYLLMRARRLEQARAGFKEAIRIDPSNAGAYVNVATTYGLQGQFGDALPYYTRAFELEPTWITAQNLNHEYGVMLVGTGQLAKAREVYSVALASPDIRDKGLRSLALLDLFQGRYKDARPRLQEAILLNQSGKNPLGEARNHLYLSAVLEGQGDSAGELRELDQAAKLLPRVAPAAWLGSYVGVAYVRSGTVEKATRLLELIKAQTDLESPEQNSDLHRLEGEIELARGNQARAIELLQLADQENHNALTLESLAHAYSKTDNVDQAIASYEALIPTRAGWLLWEPQQLCIAAHIALAQAYLSRGEKDKARKTIETLLALWKNADSDLPLLLAARRLQAETAN